MRPSPSLSLVYCEIFQDVLKRADRRFMDQAEYFLSISTMLNREWQSNTQEST